MILGPFGFVGCKLFAVFARARLGDLKSISKFTLDTSDGVDGFLECFSYSHKIRALSNAMGFRLLLVAPIQGLGPRAWGLDFFRVSQQLGQDLLS